MYRIYMPVDMVLALTHSTMRRERLDRLYRQRPQAAMVAKTTYEKRNEREIREKLDNSIDKNTCMDIFRFW
jgi:hypothetical protein